MIFVGIYFSKWIKTNVSASVDSFHSFINSFFFFTSLKTFNRTDKLESEDQKWNKLFYPKRFFEFVSNSYFERMRRPW